MSELYYMNPYQKEFITEIIEIQEKAGVYHIVLEESAFYPGNEEMACDTGFIEGCPITSVYEENNTLYHVSPKKPIKIHKAKCTLNWERRFHAMQQHMAFHLLSSYLLEHFHLETSTFQVGDSFSSITLNGLLLPTQLTELEQSINKLIGQNISIQTLLPNKQELKKLGYKKALPKGQPTLRFIELEDLCLTPCGSLPLRSTIEIQAFKLLKAEKGKGTLTLSFVVGAQAITQLLAASQESAHALQSVNKECQRLSAEVQRYKGIINDYKAKEIVDNALLVGPFRIIKAIYEELSPKELQNFGQKMVNAPNVIALLGLKSQGTSYLIFMCSKEIKKLSMNELLKDSITLIDGNGGGTDFCAQGGGKSGNNLESALDYALMQLKNKL